MRSRAIFLASALIVAGLFGGVIASSVAAATSTTVTWKVSSLTAGQVKSLSAIATSNSSGVKTWSKKGSCTLTPNSKPTKLTMGTGASCTLTLKIAKTSKYSAKTSSTTITRKLTIPTTTTTVALTCATGGSCAVGARGPGGGIIIWVDLTRAAGSQYWEVACDGWSDGTCGGSDLTDPRAEWGCWRFWIPGADGTELGTGEQNTTDIVNGCPTAGIAARVADDLVLGGQIDWFLPSKDELNVIYRQRKAIGGAIGGFSRQWYWSSSEDSLYSAWYQIFPTGSQAGYDYGRFSPLRFRPVRSF